MLNHPWLKMESNYDTRYTKEEIVEKLASNELEKAKDFKEDEIRLEMSKLEVDSID